MALTDPSPRRGSHLRHELALLVLSHYPLVAVESADERLVDGLVEQVAHDLALPLLRWSSSRGLEQGGAPALAETRDPDRALARLLDGGGERLAVFFDLQPFFDRPEVVRRLRETQSAFENSRTTLFLCGMHIHLPLELRPLAARVEVAPPSRDELALLVQRVGAELAGRHRIAVDLDDQAVDRLARALTGLELHEARRLLLQAGLADRRLDPDDVAEVQRRKQRRLGQSSLLEWVEPGAGLAQLGGAPNLKSWLAKRRDAWGESARRFGLEPPRGVLLLGVQGTGKSLACRAIAAHWQLPLLRLDVGRLYDKFVGETEANLRHALATVGAMAPAVLWIDEIEKALATGRGAADDGLSQRVMGSLLTWMQERPHPVFLAATANAVERLPPEVLRRGRFDETFFFDLPDADERAAIFAIHLAARSRDPARFDIPALAAASTGFSGAEIEGVVVAALYHAFAARQELSTPVLLVELGATRPLSVVRAETLAQLRQWGRQHAVPA